MQVENTILKDLYYKMLRIRLVEEKIAELYPEQEMRCPVHLSIGQEAVAVGACHALRQTDLVLSTHRAHAHYLSKGGDLKSMMAEIYLRVDGCCGGRGGSMHLNDTSVGFVGAVPIVGSSIPIAVGSAFKTYLSDEDSVSMAFFGEAASEEGVFYESVNFAILHKLPIVFLCENNLYSVYSPMDVRVPQKRDVVQIVKGMGGLGDRGDGNDVLDVVQKTQKAVESARNREGPVYLEFATYRWREHCGPNYDNSIGYRKEEEFENWKTKDPINSLDKLLQEQNILSQSETDEIRSAIIDEIEEAVGFAKKSSFPEASSIFSGVYAD